MCYRCGVCREIVPPSMSQRRHIVSRVVVDPCTIRGERTEIEEEIPVCASCDTNLRSMTLDALRRRVRETVVPVKQNGESEPQVDKPIVVIKDEDEKPAAIKAKKRAKPVGPKFRFRDAMTHRTECSESPKDKPRKAKGGVNASRTRPAP